MLERMLLPEHHAIAILLRDHDQVKELFDKFDKARSTSEKDKIIAAALTELKIHAIIEEEIFYPVVRSHVGSDARFLILEVLNVTATAKASRP